MRRSNTWTHSNNIRSFLHFHFFNSAPNTFITSAYGCFLKPISGNRFQKTRKEKIFEIIPECMNFQRYILSELSSFYFSSPQNSIYTPSMKENILILLQTHSGEKSVTVISQRLTCLWDQLHIWHEQFLFTPYKDWRSTVLAYSWKNC